MAQLTVSCLGTFQVKLDGAPITRFRLANVQALLFYLALQARRAFPRDVLAALFWPDEPEAAAKLNLRQSLFRLRTVLGEGDSDNDLRLLVTRTTVQFNPNSHYRGKFGIDAVGELGSQR